MDAIATLMQEHRLIEQVIDGMTRFIASVETRALDGREALGAFATFIREFADVGHHGKEENILFAAMVEAGFPRDAGPIGVMLAEHEEGRAHTQALSRLAAVATPWNSEQREAVVVHARAYGALLRPHIQKEDGILYPMAVEQLSPSQATAVNAACERFEAERSARGETAQWLTLAQRLVTWRA